MKTYYSIFILLFFSLYSYGQKDKKNYDEAIKIIEVWLEAQTAYDKLPGISASIVSDQNLIWTGAFGMANVDNKIQTEVETVCSICSISKLFTATAIMKLYDEGKLRLDDTINDLLPWYNLVQSFPESGPITIRALLSHSAGLPRENAFSHWNGPNYSFPSKIDVKSKLSSQKTIHPTATKYQYSNLAFTLLGYVVEEITGVTFDTYVTQNILKPLDLSFTSPTMPKSLYGKELAIGYGVLSRDSKRKPMRFFKANGVTAAAGFSSNVKDLGKFASWQFRLRESSKTEIIKPSTLKNMHNVHWTDSNFRVTRGLGYGIWEGANGNKWVGHDGYCPGYQTIIQLNLETKLAYSIMINANGVNINKYVRGLNALINKVNHTQKDSDKNKFLKQFTGYYEWDSFANETYVSTWQGNLAIIELPSNSPGDTMRIFKHIEGDKFRRINEDGNLGETLTFVRNSKGRIFRYKLFNNWLYTKVKR